MKKTIVWGVFCLVMCMTYAFGQSAKAVQKVSANTFKRTLDSIANKQVIDVRTPEEFETGHLKGAKNINIYDADFAEKVGSLDKTVPVMVYCKGGARSVDAVKRMQQMGFEHIYDLEGGILSWENKNLPVEKSGTDSPKDVFTIAHYDSLLAQHPNLLIDFYAPWCMPCREMEPSLKRLTKQFKGKVTIYRLNIDEAKELAKQLNIEGIPVVATYKNGVEINRVTGFQSAANLRALASEVLQKK